MGRSVKKCPYVQMFVKARQSMECLRDKRVLKTGAVFHILSGFWGNTLRFMTDASCSRLYHRGHVGHKLGEFAPTRTFRGHAGAKKTGK
jgi:small subunit ribosomal protein S19